MKEWEIMLFLNGVDLFEVYMGIESKNRRQYKTGLEKEKETVTVTVRETAIVNREQKQKQKQ